MFLKSTEVQLHQAPAELLEGALVHVAVEVSGPLRKVACHAPLALLCSRNAAKCLYQHRVNVQHGPQTLTCLHCTALTAQRVWVL